MIMVSGVPPYQYDIDVPLRSDRQAPIAHSGIFLEQAMFALNAERRRYKGEIENDDFEWFLYTSIMGANRGFEPTGSGLWMGDPDSPVGPLPGLVLNPILELRKNFMLHLLEDGFAEDSDYLPERFRRDWLHNAYPNSPSGFEEVTAEDNCSGDGNYFRRAPVHPGFQLSTDIGVLGTSGVLFDIDFGEVMYNPYPRIGRTLFGEGHTLAHQDINQFLFPNNTAISAGAGIPIPVSPVFPAFQTTSGTIIATTSRDIRQDSPRYWRITAGEQRVQLPFNSLHVESGVFRLDGDLLRPESKYFLGKGGDNAAEDFLHVAELPFVQSGVRFIGRPTHLNFDFGTKVPSGQLSNVARVFLTPAGSNDSPLESGLYHIAAANSGVHVPYSAVASGVVSHWPSGNHNRAAPGYHVFDDCIWVRDQSMNLNASGLAVISPHDGTAMWIRFASLDPITLLANLSVSQSSLAYPRMNYPGFIGMSRAANGELTMVYPLVSTEGIDSTIPTNGVGTLTNVKLYVAQYNDLLDLTTTIEGTIFATDDPNEGAHEDISSPFGDWHHDGSNFIVTHRTGESFTILDADLTPGTYYFQATATDLCRRIVFANGKYWAYAEDSPGTNLGALTELSLGVVPVGGFLRFTPGTVKTIEGADIPLGPGASFTVVNSVHHVITTSNGDHVPTGIWALARTIDENAFNVVIPGSERMWLLNIEEEASTFSVKQALQVMIPQKKAAIGVTTNVSYYDIVHMPVNPGAF